MANEPKEINPFYLMKKGEDSVDKDDNVIFSDFRPQVVPSDTKAGKSRKKKDKAPKGGSAPEPVNSEETPNPKSLAKDVLASKQTPVDDLAGAAKAPGQSKVTPETSNPASSSSPKSGPSAQTA